MQSRWSFVLLWALATAWLPVTTSIWGAALRWPWMRALGLPISTEMYVAGALAGLTLLIIAFTQWPLLAGRVPRSWLWPLAGLGAVILQQALFLAFFELSGLLGVGSVVGGALYYALPIFAAGLAAAALQTLVLRYWRIAGWSWIFLCGGAFILASLIADLIVREAYGSMPSALAVDHAALISRALGTAALWLSFGSITGWLMYRQLTGNPVRVTMPAWVGAGFAFIRARLRGLRPLHND